MGHLEKGITLLLRELMDCVMIKLIGSRHVRPISGDGPINQCNAQCLLCTSHHGYK
jgi:hypothetical protein